MTRFVVDASAVLHLVRAEVEAPGEHQLLAPTLLRSQTLSALHEAVQRGELAADVARDRLTRIGRMPIRLLAPGGRVRDPGRGAGAQRGRDRGHRVGRRAALRLERV
jgi:hypothetical protein